MLFRAINAVLAYIFYANTIVLANPDTLARAVGDPNLYREMQAMMEDKLAAATDAKPAQGLSEDHINDGPEDEAGSQKQPRGEEKRPVAAAAGTAKMGQNPSLLARETGWEFEKELRPHLDSIRRLCEVLSNQAQQPLLVEMTAIQEELDTQVGAIAKKLGTVLNNPAYDAEKISGNKGLILHALANTFVDRAGNALNGISPAIYLAVKNKISIQEALDSIRAYLDDTDKIISGIRSIEEVRLSESSTAIYIPGVYNIEHFPVVISSLTDETVKAFKLAADEAERIHAENLKHTPTEKDIPDKTIICQIITDSTVPIGQRDMIQRIGQYMAKPEKNYIERIIRLEDDKPGSFLDKLREIMAEQEKLNPGCAVEYYVACARPDDVNAVLETDFGKKLKIRAIAFEPCEPDVNAVQVEGIMLALRALRKGPESLHLAYNFLTGKDMKDLGIDINDLVAIMKQALFKVPPAKIGIDKIDDLNRLIEEYIKTAA